MRSHRAAVQHSRPGPTLRKKGTKGPRGSTSQARTRRPQPAPTSSQEPPQQALTIIAAEAPDQLTPQHWSDDDPLQIDLLIAILEQELAQTHGEGLAHVA